MLENMPQTGTLMSVNDYLSTTFRPDCEYVDGVIVERNLGEKDHSTLQMAISAALFNRRTKRAWVCTATAGMQEVKDAVLRTVTPAIEVPLAEIVGRV